jgi:hypothetical protein
VAIDGLPNAGDKFSELCVVVVRNHRTRRSSLRLARHHCEATQEASLAAADRSRYAYRKRACGLLDRGGVTAGAVASGVAT